VEEKTPESKVAEDEQSWLSKIVILPKCFGEAIFNLLGRSDASEASKFILGYMLIAAVILLILGFISPETLKAFFDTFFK
jgi:hypothetical protein